ncbi:MAG: LD-carboxypeptidase, partial [Planctomycetes bacterium]|nr:LD-carboxypeptidase [Planctomycetota bacterium]
AGLELIASPLLGRRAPPGGWLPAEERQGDLARGLDHGVLLAARGGYGCLDLVSGLLASGRTRGPLLVGYSDLTILHACWQRNGWGESLYGFLPGIGAGPRSLDSTARLLRGEGLGWSASACPTVRTLAPGRVRAPLVAACLRVLAGLVGTPAMPELGGSILAIEDIDERPYRLDRDLWQLHAAGRLAGVVGLIGGQFTAESPAAYGGPDAGQVLAGWAGRLGVPAIVGLPFGHADDPLTLPWGRVAELVASAQGWSLDISAR